MSPDNSLELRRKGGNAILEYARHETAPLGLEIHWERSPADVPYYKKCQLLLDGGPFVSFSVMEISDYPGDSDVRDRIQRSVRGAAVRRFIESKVEGLLSDRLIPCNVLRWRPPDDIYDGQYRAHLDLEIEGRQETLSFTRKWFQFSLVQPDNVESLQERIDEALAKVIPPRKEGRGIGFVPPGRKEGD